MARGNDGNYLQHCIEIEVAVRLAQTGPEGRLHVALTHGMEPFERLGEPNHDAYRLLYRALEKAAREPLCDERELVKAYRKSWAAHGYCPNTTDLFEELKEEKRYPNTAELFRTVIGTDRLCGGITETDETKHKALAEAWSGSGIVVARSSWREQLGPDGVLSCPNRLDAPWLFSMDPMGYREVGCEDDGKLYRSDLDLLECALRKFVNSGQPGFACFFVYKMGTQQNNLQRQFWAFVDDLTNRLSVQTCSYWVGHNGGNRNLAGLLFSDKELAFGFVPRGLKSGRGVTR